MIREIVKIDEDLCNGCGDCVPNCHEGALQIIDGKARLISELMCDGLGACLGHCPQGAITIEKRDAEEYDEEVVIAQMVKSGKNTVFAHLKHLQEHGETGFLNVALTYIKANRDFMPFKISEVHELLHSDKKEQPSQAQPAPGCGCAGSAPQSFSVAGIKWHQSRQVKCLLNLPSGLCRCILSTRWHRISMAPICWLPPTVLHSRMVIFITIL